MKEWSKGTLGSYILLFVIPMLFIAYFILYPEIYSQLTDYNSSHTQYYHLKINKILILAAIGYALMLWLLKVVIWNPMWRKITKTEIQFKTKTKSKVNVFIISKSSRILILFYLIFTMFIYNGNGFTNPTKNLALHDVQTSLFIYTEEKAHAITDVFTEPDFYFHTTIGLILSLIAFIFAYASMSQYILRLIIQQGAVRVENIPKVRVVMFILFGIINWVASIFLVGSKLGIYLYSEVTWLWFILDWFYSATSFQVIRLFV